MRKQLIIRGSILFVIFLASLILTVNLMNRGQVIGTRSSKEAKLPIAYMEVGDVLVNPMYGYAQEMEQQYMRDGLTPMGTDRSVVLVIDPMNSKIDRVTYQVSTADGTTIVEENPVGTLKKEKDRLRAEIQLDTAILMNQEYTLRLDVQLKNGKTYYYYTRLLQRSGINIKQYLEYVDNFYQLCVSRGDTTVLAQSMESDETETNSSYTKLNIHSSLERVTWGDMDPQIEQKAVPVIKDLNETTCSISMDYMISDRQENTPADYYHVTDFYRMRLSSSRVMLLDFERRSQELYDGEHTVLTGAGINLGVVDKDIQYQSNKNADIVGFVQEGELWAYNRSANKTTRIFSFRENYEDMDVRDNLQDHGIKIVRVDESGDMDFVVYGYMNRDAHEGQVGVGVYHYNAELNRVNEELFVPMKTAWEYLKHDMAELSYVSRGNLLYLLLEGNLYQINTDSKTSKIIQENLADDCYVISKSQASIAWMKEREENASTSITVMSLAHGDQYEITAPAGQKIKALGFLNEDLVYGLANDADIVPDSAGNTVFAMTTIRIESFGGEIVKEHHEEGVWVNDVNLEEGLLELLRVKWENGEYVPIASDHIMNNLQNNEENVALRLITTERKATQIGLDFQKSITNKNVLYVSSNLLNQEKLSKVEIDVTRQETNIFYVYAKGVLDSTWTKAGDAIRRAEEQMGVVLNRQQQYVWERGNKEDSYLANLDEVPDIILSGTIDESTIQQSLGEEYTVLNLAGCTLDSVLYLVNKGNPVIAKADDNRNVVIVGYNRYNTILYYPNTGEQGYFGIQDSTEMFERSGNVFIGYMDNMGAPSKGE